MLPVLSAILVTAVVTLLTVHAQEAPPPCEVERQAARANDLLAGQVMRSRQAYEIEATRMLAAAEAELRALREQVATYKRAAEAKP